MKRFPAFLNLVDRRVVIVGGGEAAAQKARLFAAAGADILIVAEELAESLRSEFDARAGLLERAPAPGDFIGAAIVVIAGAEPGDAKALAAAARAEGALVNVVDDPDLSDFITPSIVDRDEVVVAISTDGAAPVLGRRIRSKVEALLPARLGALASFARSFRPAVAGKLAPPARRKFWERFFDGPVAARVLAGDVRGAREAMIGAINRPQSDDEAGEGVIHIVGAGPGDPELLTLKAFRLIQEADVIFYDRLVSDDVLALARRDAERIYVGKAKANHSAPQEEISARLVAYARAGKTVVRLKGGDPFIFGRGGEELDVARAAGVPAFVTPGITAAAGCAASAGMALTHRDYSQALTFVTGHAKGEAEPDIDWASLAKLGHTLVVYMGVGKAGAISERLIEHGRAAGTPVAVIENGTLATQKTLKGTLGGLGALIEQGGVKGPAILVIGEVAALANADALAYIAETNLKRSAA
ncbi:MAG: siroheme synthase CysG [Parvularculaceae bacterium]